MYIYVLVPIIIDTVLLPDLLPRHFHRDNTPRSRPPSTILSTNTEKPWIANDRRRLLRRCCSLCIRVNLCSTILDQLVPKLFIPRAPKVVGQWCNSETSSHCVAVHPAIPGAIYSIDRYVHSSLKFVPWIYSLAHFSFNERHPAR